MSRGRSRPYSLSAPSWIVPGTYLENLDVLERIDGIDSVELLFFSFDEGTRRLLSREREGIAARKGRFGYTLHLPDPLLPEHEELLALTSDFVESYVFHPSPDPEPLAGLVDSWRKGFGDIFFLENTEEPLFEAYVKISPDPRMCCDTGRLLLAGKDPAAWLEPRKERIGEIHLHGINAGKDHAAVSASEPWLRNLKPFLSSFSGVVELEIFDLEGFVRSAAELEALCERS